MSLVAIANFTMPPGQHGGALTTYTIGQTLSTADERAIRLYAQQMQTDVKFVPAAGSTVLPLSEASFEDAGAPYQTLLLTTSSTVSLQAKELVGIRNDDTSEQSVTLTVYDNPSAASGTIIEALAALGASQDVVYPPPGLPSKTGGFTFVPSGSPGASGIQILYRV